ELDDGYALWKRQSAAVTSSFIIDTCGYYGAAFAFPATCDPGYTCAIATAQNAWGCCKKPQGCTIATTCVPQSQLASCAGNNACQGNNWATKCDTDSP
ncbi:hypothetical protein N431DRAFT_483665, partial [Stipitochalara longipes BDJ]